MPTGGPRRDARVTGDDAAPLGTGALFASSPDVRAVDIDHVASCERGWWWKVSAAADIDCCCAPRARLSMVALPR